MSRHVLTPILNVCSVHVDVVAIIYSLNIGQVKVINT